MSPRSQPGSKTEYRQRLFLLTLGSYLHPRNCSWFLLLFDGHLFDSVSSDYHVLSTNLFCVQPGLFHQQKDGDVMECLVLQAIILTCVPFAFFIHVHLSVMFFFHASASTQPNFVKFDFGKVI